MKISTLACNAALNALSALINNAAPGLLKIWTGSAPTNTTDGDTGTLLATLTFNATSFGAAASGVITANAIASDTSIDNTGTAGYFRIYDGAGTCIIQGTVGTSGADINFNSTSFVAGQTCAISSLTITQPAS